MKILFVCKHNASRSILAEAIAKKSYLDISKSQVVVATLKVRSIHVLLNTLKCTVLMLQSFTALHGKKG